MITMIDALAQDVRYGLRSMRKNPGFTATAVLSLAVGIGANCAVFSLADTLLLRPLPVPRPGDVLTVGSIDTTRRGLVASYREYVDIRDRSQSFDNLIAFTNFTAAFAADATAPPEPRFGMLVSGNFFPAMGVELPVGRGFRPDEDRVPNRDAVVILGHDFWTLRFNADRSILGRRVRLNGVEFTVIGVTPPDFPGLEQHSRFEFYAPLMMWPRLLADSPIQPLEARDFRSVTIKGRLKPGIAKSQAQAELSLIAADLERASPATNRNRPLLVRTELQARIAQAPPNARLMAMLTTLAVAVLLVACANVAGLLTSRAPVRAREIALRLAIGAGRGRLMRQLLTESLLLAAVGAVLALGIGYAAVTLFGQIRFPTDLPIVPSFVLDRRAFVFSLIVAAASVMLFGMAPAIQATRADLTAVMKATDAAGFGRRRRLGRACLVAGQVAAAVVLLFVATFMYRGFRQQVAAGPGYRTDHVLTMMFEPGLIGYSELQAQQFFDRVAERARLVPGIRSAALASSSPMNGAISLPIVPEGVPLPVGVDSVTVLAAAVDEHYLETLGIPLVAGRGFGATDSAAAPRVAIVNEQLARTYWPGQNPLGKRFRPVDGRGEWIAIVGVARTAKYTILTEPPRSFVYLPYTQHPQRRMVLLAESVGDPAGLAAPLREVVRGLDPHQPMYNVRPLEEIYRMRSITILNVIISLVAAMGTMGLALAIVGLYGLVAYTASRRTREIGIRMAIGAGRAAVLRMVLRHGAMLAVIGLAVGLVASIGANRAMAALFRDDASGGRTDLVAFVVVSTAVLLVTFAAAYVPARRAASVNPIEALRHD